MSMFASRTQLTVALPFDEGQTVTIRKLPGRHLENARIEKQVASHTYVTRMGGQEFRKQLAEIGDTAVTKALVAKAQADPLNTYDAYVVLYKGIVAWTYQESLQPVDVVDEDGVKRPHILAIDDLDDEAVDFLAREILKLSKPLLFQTPAEQEAEKKSESASSSLA